MENFDIHFPEIDYHFPMIFVKGTGGVGYLFGSEEKVSIEVSDYYISGFPVTQKLWKYVMGSNPSHFKGEDRPAETVSFNEIYQENGFLDKLNLVVRSENFTGSKPDFRLPSEAEWEYAARGGVNWKDDFLFSGSNDLNEVGWYDGNSGKYSDPQLIARLKNHQKETTTHEVGKKLPNQLGIYDMCGNVWEWCEDYFQRDIHKIPSNAAPYAEKTNDRVLRGGCHHNWLIHCTVSKRYEITPDAKDECIGFRIAATINA